MDKETQEIESDSKTMADVKQGIVARQKKSEDYYVEWGKAVTEISEAEI